jgi:hypothetical protein
VEGEEFAFEVEAEVRVGGEEFLDNGLVFFGFEAAGAVENGASGFEAGGGLGEEVELGRGEAGDFGFFNAPAEIDAAAEDAGVGTGGVDEDAIKSEWRVASCEL